MKKEFIINIVLLVIISLLIKPAYIFGIEAKVQHIVGFESYGLYFHYFNFVMLFQFVGDPGLQNWNAQFIAKNRENIKSHLSTLMTTKLILSFLFLVVVFVSAAIFDKWNWNLLFFVSINLILSTTFLLLRGCISGLGHYRIDTWLSSLDKILMILVIGYFLWFPRESPITIYMFAIGQTIAYGLSCLVAVLWLKTKDKFSLNFQFSISDLRDIVKQCLPFLGILIFMTLYNRMDGVLLSQLIDDNYLQSGMYAACYRFYDAAFMISFLFASLLLPMFASNVANRSVTKGLLNIAMDLIAGGTFLFVCIVYYYGKDLLRLTNDQPSDDQWKVLIILACANIFASMTNILGPLLLARGEMKKLTLGVAIVALLNLILNIILIKSSGALGASITCLVTQWLVMMIFLIQSKEFTSLTIIFKRVSIILSMCASIFSIFFFFHHWIHLPVFYTVASCLGISSIIIMVFLTNHISKDFNVLKILASIKSHKSD